VVKTAADSGQTAHFAYERQKNASGIAPMGNKKAILNRMTFFDNVFGM
jgi:hypothetical protein